MIISSLNLLAADLSCAPAAMQMWTLVQTRISAVALFDPNSGHSEREENVLPTCSNCTFLCSFATPLGFSRSKSASAKVD